MLSSTIQPLRGQAKHFLPSKLCDILRIPAMSFSTVKDYPVPKDYSGVEAPERSRLPIVKKVPMLTPGQRVIKMKKNVAFTRGPEMVNNMFLHKQYGVVALEGGRLCHEHFEFIRMSVIQRMKGNAFAMWRVDDPWQAISKKSQGKPMGGGKGPVDHYATPVRAGRVIFEVGGHVTYDEVKFMLRYIASRLPFASRAYDYKSLLAERKLEQMIEERNINPFTFKYCIQNNLGDCHSWIKDIDRLWYGRYR